MGSLHLRCDTATTIAFVVVRRGTSLMEKWRTGGGDRASGGREALHHCANQLQLFLEEEQLQYDLQVPLPCSEATERFGWS